MRLFLGSGGFSTDARRAIYAQHLANFLGKTKKVLFLPYALHDYDRYTQNMNDAPHHRGLSYLGIHRCSDPVAAIESCEAIYVGGGNTFRLLNTLYSLKLLEVIRKRVRGGLPYIGVSAGTNVACPTIQTTNDMPIVQPPSLRALQLIDFQINPHYFSGPIFLQYGNEKIKYGGETRDDRISEFHEMNQTPVMGLWEGSLMIYEGQKFHLHGEGGARLFKRGQRPVDLQPGQRIAAI